MNIGTNAVAKIIILVFALLLWFDVTTDATFTYRVTVPLRYSEPSSGFVVTGELPDQTVLVLRGRGKDLLPVGLRGLFKPRERYIYVDLEGLPAGLNTVPLQRSAFRFGISSDINIQDIISPKNGVIPVEIQKSIKLTVPVSIDSIPPFRIQRGFAVTGPPSPVPHEISLVGPENELSKMRSISIDSLEESQLNTSRQVLRGRLSTPPHITAEPAEIELHFDVEPAIVKKIRDIPVILTGFPSGEKLKPIIQNLEIDIRGARSIVEEIKPEDIKAIVRYEDYIGQSGSPVDVPVYIEYPEGIVPASPVQEKVTLNSSSP